MSCSGVERAHLRQSTQCRCDARVDCVIYRTEEFFGMALNIRIAVFVAVVDGGAFP